MDRGKNGLKQLIITIIRVAIGWHFLYEGISKLFIDNWTSQGYLSNTSGFLSGFYHWLAGGEALVKVVDFMNIYGLILIGLALFVGLFIRIASIGGMALLVLYYFAYPPFGTSLFGGTEGHFYIVDRNFIEALLLLWFVIGKQTGYGIELLINSRIHGKKQNTNPPEEIPETGTEQQNSRREALRNLASLPFLGAMGWGAFRHS